LAHSSRSILSTLEELDRSTACPSPAAGRPDAFLQPGVVCGLSAGAMINFDRFGDFP
jgi:hypothetical protein